MGGAMAIDYSRFDVIDDSDDEAEETQSSLAKSRVCSIETKEDKLRKVDALLACMAADKDLHEHLQHPKVRKAIDHWTSRERPSNSEANELMDTDSTDYRYHIKPTLDKLRFLQGACTDAGMAVPIDHVLQGKTSFHREETLKEKPPDSTEGGS